MHGSAEPRAELHGNRAYAWQFAYDDWKKMPKSRPSEFFRPFSLEPFAICRLPCAPPFPWILPSPWKNPIVNQMPNERPIRNGLQASKIAQQGRPGEWRLQP